MREKRTSSKRHSEGEGLLMPLGAHLEELRSRLIKCLMILAGTFILCWVFRERLMVVLTRPHVSAVRAFEFETTLKFRSYLEPVVAQLKACVVVALVLTAPVLIYQTWAFVAPGLFRRERHKTLKLGAACVTCFAAGVCFGYFLFVPVALRYLLGLSGAATEPVLMIGSYLSMFFLLTFALGIAFQTPVVIYYLIRWGVLDADSLQRNRKAVILAAFVIAAVLTPPDPLTQVMMAVTLIVLYDLGGLLAAPSRATLKGFLKFTGAVVLVAGVFVGWYAFWPVAEASALQGVVEAGKRQLSAGQAAKLPRGIVCRTGTDATARIAFGREGGPKAYLAGGGRLHIHGPRSISLYNGDSLVVSPDSRGELTVHTVPGTVTFAGARAELSCPDEDTLAVSVFEGQVLVKTGGATRRIAAGQTATFRKGGEAADLSDAQRRWRELLQEKEAEQQRPTP